MAKSNDPRFASTGSSVTVREQDYLPVKMVADLWSKEEGMLPADEVSLTIWAAFWRGEFEADGKTAWGFRAKGDRRGHLPRSVNRAWLFNLLREDGGLDFDPSQPPKWIDPAPNKRGWFDRIQPADAPEVDYQRLAGWRRSDYANVRKSIRTLIEGAVISRSAFVSWCKRTGQPIPAFWMRPNDKKARGASTPSSPLTKPAPAQERTRKVLRSLYPKGKPPTGLAQKDVLKAVNSELTKLNLPPVAMATLNRARCLRRDATRRTSKPKSA